MDGMTRETFLCDRLRQDAVMLRVAIIGEAATRLSESFRTDHPEVNWRIIRRMRNILIHIYDQVDSVKVWDTVQDDLTPLQNAVTAMLAADTSWDDDAD